MDELLDRFPAESRGKATGRASREARRRIPRKSGKRALDILFEEDDVNVTPRKRLRLSKQTPIKPSIAFPARNAESDSSSEPSDDEVVENDALKIPSMRGLKELLQQSILSLKKLKTADHIVHGGVDLHALLIKVQSALLNGDIKLPKGDLMRCPAIYLATRSCLLLEHDVFEATYRPFLTETMYDTLSNLLKDWRLVPPSPTKQQKQNARKFIKSKEKGANFRAVIDPDAGECAITTEEAQTLDTLYSESKPTQPHKTSDATCMSGYVWPYTHLLPKEEVDIELDVKVVDGLQRPDILISNGQKFVRQALCLVELKTQWASEALKEKETARVIDKVLAAYRTEIAFSYNQLAAAPKLALTIKGLTSVST
ncbi:hypothetical protein HDU85_005180 [Gaertneriomyces sp. JEL0708]|nr:hypothetical protein HDU85_005180 [Gaertneriomyces sp. JEL0708]